MHLLFQPVVVLNDASHHCVGSLHVERDLSRRFVLKPTTNSLNIKRIGRAKGPKHNGSLIDAFIVILLPSYSRAQHGKERCAGIPLGEAELI